MAMKNVQRDVVLKQALHESWAHMAFSIYTRRQRVLHGFFARVRAGRHEDGTDGVPPIIAWGDANFSGNPVMAGVPFKALLAAARHVIGPDRVIHTTEHRSSKCCAACGHILQNVYQSDGNGGRKLVWALKRCVYPRCPKRGRVVNRDFNGSLNVGHAQHALDRGEDVPEHMRKGPHDGDAADLERCGEVDEAHYLPPPKEKGFGLWCRVPHKLAPPLRALPAPPATVDPTAKTLVECHRRRRGNGNGTLPEQYRAFTS
jgi:hypothetical protein